MLPPEESEDFDSQLQSAIQDLRKIKSGLLSDVGLLYLSKDFENIKDKCTPVEMRLRLMKSGFTV